MPSPSTRHIEVLLPRVTAVSSSDTGSGTETQSILVASSETGTGTDKAWPSGSSLLFDDFARADGSLGWATTGQAWAVAASTFAIGSGAAVEAAGATAGRQFAYAPAWMTDIIYTANITLSPTTNTTDIGVVVRQNDVPNRLYVRVRKTSGSNRVDLLTSPGDVVLASNTSAGLVDGANITLTVITAGPVITVKVNGTTLFTHTLTGGNETTYIGSGVGLTINTTNDSGSRIEYVQVEPNQSLRPTNAKNIAHRGRHNGDPENTITSTQALPPWVDGPEIDVRYSSDGIPMLMHDATVDRTTNGTGAITSLSYATLAALTVTGSNGTTSSIPRLVDYLAACESMSFKWIQIDMNNVSNNTNNLTAINIVKASPLASKCIFMCRGAAEMAQLRALDATIRLGSYGTTVANVSSYVAGAITSGAEVLYIDDVDYPTEHAAVATILANGLVAGGSIRYDNPTSLDSDDIALALSDGCLRILWDYAPLWNRFTTPGVSSTDTGSGSDVQSISVTFTSTDVGAGLEDPTVVSETATEAGSGADAQSITVQLSGAETPTGLDDNVVLLASSETSSAVDAQSLAALLVASDTGAGLEDPVEGVTSTDSAAGVDAHSISMTATSTDSGSATDAQGQGVLSSDAATAVEFASIVAALASSDAGFMADLQAIDAGAFITGSDSGSGVDEAFLIPLIPSPTSAALSDSGQSSVDVDESLLVAATGDSGRNVSVIY